MTNPRRMLPPSGLICFIKLDCVDPSGIDSSVQLQDLRKKPRFIKSTQERGRDGGLLT